MAVERLFDFMWLTWGCRGKSVVIVNTQLGDKLLVAKTDELLASYAELEDSTGKYALDRYCVGTVGRNNSVFLFVGLIVFDLLDIPW